MILSTLTSDRLPGMHSMVLVQVFWDSQLCEVGDFKYQQDSESIRYEHSIYPLFTFVYRNTFIIDMDSYIYIFYYYTPH